MSDPIVGIDLGTSNTVVAHASASAVQVLADSSGFKIHPSVVSFHPNGGVVVGAGAKQRKVIDPKNTIYSVKRLIGRSFTSPEVTIARGRMPYLIKQGANQLPLIATRGGEFAVPEISAILLDHVKNVATAALGTEVSRAVVTVPASFNDAQRSATATAGSIAGLTVVRVLNEPTAAALAYGHSRNLRETIAVYDFGGGTFDITILKLERDVYEVLGTAGDTFLGGDDIDERLVDRMVEKFLAEHRIDLRTNDVSMMRMRAVAEQTKIELSRRTRALVRIDEIAYGPNGKPLDLQIEIRREEMVKQVADLIDRTFPVCEEALRLANLTIDHIDDVILVGGTTKIPYVRDQVSKFFAKAPRTDVNPEEAVASGAALQASALAELLDRQSESEITRPLVDTPMPQAPVDDGIDLTLAPPIQRVTAGYAQATRRAPSKGEHSDIFEERTPPPVSPNAPVIGRMTKSAAKPPATPRTTQPVPRIARPPAPPAVPVAAPSARTLLGTDVGFPHIGTEKDIVDVELDFPDAKTERSVELDPSFEIDLETPSPASTSKGMAPAKSSASAKPIAPGETSAAAKTIAPANAGTLVAPPAAPRAPAAPLAATMILEPAPGASPQPARVPVIMDVTPRGLGIATVAGFCEELIRRNSRVPTEMRRVFSTSRDGQDSVRIVVCQGESRRLEQNVVIGDLRLVDLPPRPRGETSIEVTFMLDASGILNVHARDVQTGKEQRTTFSVVGAMPDQAVDASRERLQSLRR